MIAGFLTLDPGVSDKAASGGRVRTPPPPHQRNDASGATGRPGTQGRDSRSRCYCVPEAKVEKNGLEPAGQGRAEETDIGHWGMQMDWKCVKDASYWSKAINHSLPSASEFRTLLM